MARGKNQVSISVHQPKKGEKPSAFVKRLVKEGVERRNIPIIEARTEPSGAYGADCPDCRGRKVCDQCGYRP